MRKKFLSLYCLATNKSSGNLNSRNIMSFSFITHQYIFLHFPNASTQIALIPFLAHRCTGASKTIFFHNSTSTEVLVIQYKSESYNEKQNTISESDYSAHCGGIIDE